MNHISALSKAIWSTIVYLCVLKSTVLGQTSPYCHFLGPVFPAPGNYSAAPPVQQALKHLKSSFSDLISDGTYDGLESVVSVSVFDEQERLLNFSYAPPDMRQYLTSGKLDEDTLFRIGSISKVLAVYTLLAEVGFDHMYDPVTRWVPELATQCHGNTSRMFSWDDITVGALTNHLAGLPRSLSLEDLVQVFEGQELNETMIEALGLPMLPDDEKPGCGASQELNACTREEFFRDLEHLSPVAAPFQTPIYSNLAFQILGYAIEGITGKTFDAAARQSLLQPLGLSNTFVDAPVPDAGNAIIPSNEGDAWFDKALGSEAPAGGFVSSTKDMTTIGQSILSSALLSPATTRAWFKPTSHTYDLKMSVGMPWEIRSMLLPLTPGSNMTRRVDIYAKDGGIGAYKSIMVFSPDHNFGFVVLVASLLPSSGSLLSRLPEIIVQTMLPALEEAARQDAASAFAGRYTDAESGMALDIVVDDVLPGLRVSNWTRGDLDVLQSLASLRYGPGVAGRLTLYPMQRETEGRLSFRGVWEREGYRANDPRYEDTVFLRGCPAWAAADSVKYGNVGLDDFEFIRAEDGGVGGISPRVMRRVLSKTG